MLPSILEVAIQHGLQRNDRASNSKEDVRFKCPFCQADDMRTDKYYLLLNTNDNVFHCWSCHEHGGVLKLIALLEKVSMEEDRRV